MFHTTTSASHIFHIFVFTKTKSTVAVYSINFFHFSGFFYFLFKYPRNICYMKKIVARSSIWKQTEVVLYSHFKSNFWHFMAHPYCKYFHSVSDGMGRQRSCLYTFFFFWNTCPLFLLIWLVGDYEENFRYVSLCSSVLAMLKHKFTSSTNTKLRTAIKRTHKVGGGGAVAFDSVAVALYSFIVEFSSLCNQKWSAPFSPFYCG